MLTVPLLMLTVLTAITTKHTSKTSPFQAFDGSAIFAQRGHSLHRATYLSTILATLFQTDWIADVYRAVDAADRLRVETEAVSDEDIAAWIAK